MTAAESGFEVVREEPRDGYVLRTQRDHDGFEMVAAYSPDGHYIGSEDRARFLAARGVRPELTDATHRVCSIGFSEREQRWYGWSHRAWCSFGIGDVAREGDCVTHSGYTAAYLAAHPERSRAVPVGFVARTLDDARRMAVAYADSVG